MSIEGFSPKKRESRPSRVDDAVKKINIEALSAMGAKGGVKGAEITNQKRALKKEQEMAFKDRLEELKTKTAWDRIRETNEHLLTAGGEPFDYVEDDNVEDTKDAEQ